MAGNACRSVATPMPSWHVAKSSITYTFGEIPLCKQSTKQLLLIREEILQKQSRFIGVSFLPTLVILTHSICLAFCAGSRRNTTTRSD
jgi:hypothetical protein